ncbi:WD40/YVTN/BNR-like repeat-containing protein [Denitromonas iodatirespirans]|uniref:Glycosyl hydrolase n=1 Tax=Denitromonas iodatirespirans TaxID=2795389 RepID=A0A944DA89_DENI1|nr:YCF48-related protein [Denitromonas iodatirespirans]MBT0961617.1 glycosyl hydrolase [Denitromonas iodatirespirans]
MKRFVQLICWVVLTSLSGIVAAIQEPAALTQQPARTSPFASAASILAATSAGARQVAVGDQGTVLLSDDDGRSFRQASSVPTRVTLTSVSFADPKHGWAVGQWGTILVTEDGGENWRLQRTDTSTDRPLFAIHAIDRQRAVAVGLWSLVLVTGDGGQTWQARQPPAPPDGGRADRNLLGMFAHGDDIYVPAERGLVLTSADGGNTWRYLDTGYRGSLWAGIALDDGVLLVGGLRGSVYRSEDRGDTWQAIDVGTTSSITDFADSAQGVVAVALDGVVLRSTDGGVRFSVAQRDDRAALTAVLTSESGRTVGFSKRGVVDDLLPQASRTPAGRP